MQSKGWIVVDVKEDLDISGSDKGLRLDRPGLVYIRSRWADIDLVVFAKLDRLARNVFDFLSFNEEAKAHGVDLVSVAEGLDMSTGVGRMQTVLLASFAEMEASAISDRVKQSIKHRKLLGRHTAGRAVYGYKRTSNPEGKGTGTILVVNPEQQVTLQEMATRVIAGEPVYRIANDVSDRGILTNSGRRWDGRNIRDLLTTESILGRVIHQGQPLRDETTGTPLQFWEPLIDLETFQRLQDKLAVTPRVRARKPTARLLSGLGVCDLCGQNLYVNGTRNNYTYSCPGKTNGKNCVGTAVTCSKIEDYIIELFLQTRGSWPVYELGKTPRTHVEITEVERSIKATTDAMQEPDADVAALVDQLEKLKNERKRLSKEPKTTTEIRATGKTYQQAWEATELVEEHRSILGKAFSSIRLKKGVKGRTGPFDPRRVEIWGPKPRVILDENNVGRTMGPSIDQIGIGEIRLIMKGKILFPEELSTFETAPTADPAP